MCVCECVYECVCRCIMHTGACHTFFPIQVHALTYTQVQVQVPAIHRCRCMHLRTHRCLPYLFPPSAPPFSLPFSPSAPSFPCRPFFTFFLLPYCPVFHLPSIPFFPSVPLFPCAPHFPAPQLPFVPSALNPCFSPLCLSSSQAPFSSSPIALCSVCSTFLPAPFSRTQQSLFNILTTFSCTAQPFQLFAPLSHTQQKALSTFLVPLLYKAETL